MSELLGTWEFGSHLLSVEDIRGGQGPLGVSYAAGVDTRYDDTCMAPLLTSVSLAGSDAAGGGSVGTAATVRSAAFTGNMNPPEKMLLARGTKLGAIRLDTRASLFDGTAEGAGVPYTEAVNHLHYTKSATGTHEVSICFDDVIYRSITDVPETGGYTASANNESHKYRVMFDGGSDAAATVVLGLGRGSGTVQNKVASNTLSGSTTQDASAWQSRATIGTDVVFTGGAMDGRYALVGTNDGVYLLDSDLQKFRPQQDELPADPNNHQCFGLQAISFLGPGVLNPTIRGLRMSQDANSRSVGVEMYPNNTSPVNGRYGHSTASERWIYMPIYNTVTGESYIMALRPRQPGDAHDQPLSWYTLFELDSLESKICVFSGFKGGVTSPTVWVGRGSDVGWFLEPLTQRPWDDSNMTFGVAGTLYGTLLRRDPDKGKIPEFVTLETAGCTATETIAIDMVFVDRRGVEQTVRCGAPITKNGRQKLPVPRMAEGVAAFYPKVTLASAGGNATPRIKYRSLRVWGSKGEMVY
jgi:hypothetical protein